MAIELVGVTKGYTTSGDLVVAPHANAASGDLLVLTSMHLAANPAAPAPTSPEWGVIMVDRHPTTGDYKAEWNANYWCWFDDYVTSAIPAGVATAGRNAVLTVWRGVDPVTPFEDPTDTTISGAASWSLGSITTQYDGSMIIHAVVLGEDGSSLVSISNANLTDLAQVEWSYGSFVFGGDILIAAGLMETAGAIGATAIQTAHGLWTVGMTYGLKADTGGGGGGPSGLHHDALQSYLLANETVASREVVGMLNELNGTTGVEYAEARATYLAG